MKRRKTTVELDVDEDGEVTLITWTHLGHIEHLTEDDIPEHLQAEFRRERELFDDGIACANAIKAAVRTYRGY